MSRHSNEPHLSPKQTTQLNEQATREDQTAPDQGSIHNSQERYTHRYPKGT